jgi:RNase P subunit RPR2
MEVRTRSRVARYPRLSNYCAQCGEVMFMPEWSEYLSEHRVRHLWTCDSCGYRFETVVAFPESATAA